jgi:hypothetical protein
LDRYTNSQLIPIGRRRGDGGCRIVAEVNGSGGVPGETEGDKLARLFAASPELLAALETATNELEVLAERCAMLADYGELIDDLRAKCSKAKGQP